MPDSPRLDAEGVLRATVQCNGNPIADSVQLVRAVVRHQLNRVPVATLTFVDGDMPEQTFPLSDRDDFRPGAEITLKAGWGEQEEVIFKGIVVKHGIRISGDDDGRLIVECRDRAVKMTVGRSNAVFIDKTDAEVMKALIDNHAGLTARVSGAALMHKQLLQHYCSDWDFLLARAEANGCVVVAIDGTVKVAEPDFNGDPVLKVAYGDSLIELEAELDARHQYAAVQARSWDIANQAVLQGALAAPQAQNGQGNLDSRALAHVLSPAVVGLQSTAALPKDALDAWAHAMQLKSGLSRLAGRMRILGSAKAVVGGLIELEGVGTRFAGNVYVSGLTHTLADGHWDTDCEFGAPAEWFTERVDIVAPSASGLVPGVEGLHVGVVTKLDGDPATQHRVQVKLPVAGLDRVWARLMQAHASNGFGAFFVPEVGDEVVIGFFNHDPQHPVVLGSLYSSKHAPAYALAAENNTKALVTRCKHKLEFDEKNRLITITTPAANKLVFSDKDQSVTITDQNNNKLVLDSNGILLDSPKDITLMAKGAITIDAVRAVSISSKADVKAEGLNVACTAQVGFSGKGLATAELSASGQTTVKGAMVLIN